MRNAFNRQFALNVVEAVGVKDIGEAVQAKLPMGALVTAISVIGLTAFDGGDATLTVTDGTTTFANAVDVGTAGNKTVANVPKFYPFGGEVSITLAQDGDAATEGDAIVRIEYVIRGAGENVYG